MSQNFDKNLNLSAKFTRIVFCAKFCSAYLHCMSVFALKFPLFANSQGKG